MKTWSKNTTPNTLDNLTVRLFKMIEKELETHPRIKLNAYVTKHYSKHNYTMTIELNPK